MANQYRGRVLVIDDEVGPRESLRIVLKDEYEVYCAESVGKGLELLRSVGADVIILDIRMPGKSGIVGLEEIRRMDRDVAVIMLTGYATLRTAREAIRLGANDYLTKPFDAFEIRKIVGKNVARTRFERRRTRTAFELEVLNKELSDELARVERLAALGQVSAEILHDLRNPLTIVMGYTELLAEELEKARPRLGENFDETIGYLDIIERNVERCRLLASTWQSAERSDTDKTGPVEVHDIMRDVRATAEFLAMCHKAKVDFDIEAGDAKLIANRTDLLRALHNLVMNALQAVEESGGGVKVVSRKEGDGVRIEIQDNGPGIDPEDLQRIFQPYFTTKPAGKGTGLGLAITKRIVEDHKGTIDVDSRVGEGTRVVLRLPLANGPGTAG